MLIASSTGLTNPVLSASQFVTVGEEGKWVHSEARIAVRLISCDRFSPLQTKI